MTPPQARRPCLPERAEGVAPVRAPAQVAPFVDALGEDHAIRFLLNFGGAELTIPATPSPRGRLQETLGAEGAEALAAARDLLPRRIPLAKPWLARTLAARGMSTAQIARTILASDVSVRAWLKKTRGR
ncbi:helix-turn-helix domain-containing protein [Rhodovulum sp. DZ06]|uniref:helix-turn-helix domain-containing protein n=1 Tax=Rhodovulum sp. DZ06 TaxID=3425126 RepID=UPI003D33EFF8